MVVLPTRPLCLLYTVIVIPIHSQRAFFITFVDLKTVGSESLSPSIVMSMPSLEQLTVEAKVSGPVANLSCRV